MQESSDSARPARFPPVPSPSVADHEPRFQSNRPTAVDRLMLATGWRAAAQRTAGSLRRVASCLLGPFVNKRGPYRHYRVEGFWETAPEFQRGSRGGPDNGNGMQRKGTLDSNHGNRVTGHCAVRDRTARSNGHRASPWLGCGSDRRRRARRGDRPREFRHRNRHRSRVRRTRVLRVQEPAARTLRPPSVSRRLQDRSRARLPGRGQPDRHPGRHARDRSRHGDGRGGRRRRDGAAVERRARRGHQ